MSKSYVRAKQGFKQNSNNNYRKTKNNKSYNRKNAQKKYYNSNNNNNNKSNNNIKAQKKKEMNEVPVKKEICDASMKKMVHFNEIVEVGYTHAPEEYDRTSIATSEITNEDIIEMINLRKQSRMETMEAIRQRAMEESQPVSSPCMSDLNLTVYASTSIGNSSLLTEVPAVTPSIISSPVLTPRNLDDEILSQKRKEIEYMIYQKQQMENNYFEALQYQKALQYIIQQQQQNLWKMYTQPQQQTFVDSEFYLQQANSAIFNNINNVSPSMTLWYAQDQFMIPPEYESIPLMTQMEVM